MVEITGRELSVHEDNASSLLQPAIRNWMITGLGSLVTFALGFIFARLTIRFLGEGRARYLLVLQSVIAFAASVPSAFWVR